VVNSQVACSSASCSCSWDWRRGINRLLCLFLPLYRLVMSGNPPLPQLLYFGLLLLSRSIYVDCVVKIGILCTCLIPIPAAALCIQFGISIWFLPSVLVFAAISFRWLWIGIAQCLSFRRLQLLVLSYHGMLCPFFHVMLCGFLAGFLDRVFG
jgi:hypothetical protein